MPVASRLSVGLRVVAFVGKRRPRRNVWADIEQRLEIAAVAGLAAGQMEGDWQAVEIGLEMDFCREAAARTPERLVFLPPFAPAAETCARTMVESNI